MSLSLWYLFLHPYAEQDCTIVLQSKSRRCQTVRRLSFFISLFLFVPSHNRTVTHCVFLVRMRKIQSACALHGGGVFARLQDGADGRVGSRDVRSRIWLDFTSVLLRSFSSSSDRHNYLDIKYKYIQFIHFILCINKYTFWFKYYLDKVTNTFNSCLISTFKMKHLIHKI